MSNRLLKLLPILLAFVLICSVSVFAVFAEGEDPTSTPAEETQDAASEDVASGDETEDEADKEETEDEADKEETKDEAGKEETKDDSSATTSPSAPVDDHAGHNHGEETSGGLSARNWQLIITAAVVVILIAVLFILAKTNTKIGQKIANFFKNNKSEIKKIVWMPKNDLIKSTGIVLLVLVAACALIGLLDLAFSTVLKLLSSIG